MNDLLALTKALLACPSITPSDAGCQALIGARLETLGFSLTPLRFGEVDNLWATHGNGEPYFVFAGHTDVVSPGSLTAWRSDPFVPTQIGDLLYARGAADMKGGLAAMVLAAERFIQAQPNHRGTLAFLLTSDEEGEALDGTRKVVDYLQEQAIPITWCVVGEPSSEQRIADVIKHGRRGSLNAVLTVQGVQGHVAYPAQADNPIHAMLPALRALCTMQLDEGNQDFPPTTLQISNIHAGTGAENVTPGTAEVKFNIRYATTFTAAVLQQRVTDLLHAEGLDYKIDWRHSGEPFLTRSGELLAATEAAICEEMGYAPRRSTGGGTSDGRFIAKTGAEVVELGPINATIHKVNEHVSVSDLQHLCAIYQRLLNRLLAAE